jgi:hypothetical protein
MQVRITNKTAYQRYAPSPFGQMKLNAYGSGQLPWTFFPTEEFRSLEKQIETGEIDVDFTPDRLEKYFRGYFSKLLEITGVKKPSSRTFRADYATIQDAIDAVASEAAVGNRFVIELPPDDFVENVVVPPFVSLRGGSIGRDTRISSPSGVTLTVPAQNSGIKGVNVVSTSANPADAALRFIADAGAFYTETFVIECIMAGTNGAIGVWIDNTGPSQVIMLSAGVDGYVPGGPAIFVDGGGLAWYVGGGGAPIGFAGTTDFLKAQNGGSAFVSQVNFSCDPAGGGAAVDLDGGLLFGQSMMLDGDNILKMQNGSMAIMQAVKSFGGPGAGGRAVDDDGTGIIVQDDVSLDGIGVPTGYGGLGWSAAGTTIMQLNDLEFSSGTKGLGGPDRRITALGVTPPTGARFLATDGQQGNPAIVGPGCNLTYQVGRGWVDPSDTVHP